MPPVQEPTPPHVGARHGEDPGRGRPRSRSDDRGSDGLDLADEAADADADGNHATSSNSDGPTRKRRRSRKGLVKKFECPEKGCGKSYSRAEHLYRHQLNHNPKQLYRCDWGDCNRTFVRLDLCNRHKDRHTAKGSALSRKDSIMSHGSPVADGRPPFTSAGSASPEANRPGSGYSGVRPVSMQYGSPKDGMASPYATVANTPTAAYSNGGGAGGGAHSNGIDYVHHDGSSYHSHHPHHHQAAPGQRAPPHHSHSSPDPRRPSLQTSVAPYGVLSPVSTQHGYHSQPTNTPQSSTVMPYVTPQNFPPISLPPSDFAPASVAVPREGQQSYAPPPPTSGEYSDQSHQPGAGGDMVMLDTMGMPAALSVFGGESSLNKSPHAGLPEDFMAFLFNSGAQGEGSSPIAGVYGYGDFHPNQYSIAYYGAEPTQMGYFPSAAPQQVMSVTNLVDQNPPESVLSTEKADEILEFIKERFHENGNVPLDRRLDSIIEGDRGDDSHVLSRKMMQAYIGSYWVHFSEQVPILHKPTFSPDKTQNLLLIAMMMIGAACLDKAHGHAVTRAGAKLSNFLAWHLRWEMFQDPNCRPPAKLWAFQALLLLELYEKIYSTRELHERAHIHHATTITLMRRGRALIGKSPLDSPPNPRDPDKQNGPSSRHSSSTSMATPEEWWNTWITNEATRRAAFTAFFIDSIHATMFGHSTVMVAHEMRLPLPCDEKMWSATSGAEVYRIENSLSAAGKKPLPFLEALKRTLSNQEVQTNSFGRTILMAGLLSVSWHMNQRDVQVTSLGNGVSQALGGRDKWRGTLTRAFDSWKSDFDKSLSAAGGRGGGPAGAGLVVDPYAYDPTSRTGAGAGAGAGGDDNVVFESRTVLHHLAHMAMHVDIVDCQIYARARRLLGRAIGTQDLNNATRKMRGVWAPSAKARDATYYALRFLYSVLVSEDDSSSSDAAMPLPTSGYNHPEEPYSARDDVLLNRPWVLYFAALVVWCYGHALEGPCPNLPVPTSRPEKIEQMRQYLLQYGRVSSPEELKRMKGINQNTALLMVLKDTFEVARWELLHEGANLLHNCINLNMNPDHKA